MSPKRAQQIKEDEYYTYSPQYQFSPTRNPQQYHRENYPPHVDPTSNSNYINPHPYSHSNPVDNKIEGSPPVQLSKEYPKYPTPNNGPPQNSNQMSPTKDQYTNVSQLTPDEKIKRFNDIPVDCICGFCNQPVTTKLKYKAGSLSWILLIVLVCFGCILGCCLIPLIAKPCKDVLHICPKCHKLIHRYKRLSHRVD